MAGFLRRMAKALHPEGIPWPASLIYNALSKSSTFQHHYELVSEDVASFCTSGRLLDVGTGPGWLLLRLHERCPALRLSGVDISPGMVSKARENVARAGRAGSIEIREGSAYALPYEDASFDAVVSTGSLHHWKEPLKGLNEVHRVLVPGGRGLMYDLVKQMPAEVRRNAVQRFGRYRMALLVLHSFEEPFYDAAEMETLAARSAFGGGQTRFVGALCCLDLEKKV